MPRSKKPHSPQDPKTGDDFIERAKAGGALVEPSRKGFTKISTPQGSMYITPGTQPLDPRTRKNIKHWFRLLGLLVIILGCLVGIFYQEFLNWLWILQNL